MSLAPRPEHHKGQLSITDALASFDRWNNGDPGPAYGADVLYNACRIELEELVRAVLIDHGRDPECWQGNAEVVHSAFEVWKRLTRPFVPGDELDELTEAV